MTKEDCFYLGKITRLHSFKGELEVFLDVDQPDNYIDIDMFYVEIHPGQKLLVPHFIETIQSKRSNRLRIRLEDVETEEQASLLVNKSIYLPLEELPELGADQFYYHEIPGFTVIDREAGEIGKVSHVVDQGINHMLAVEKDELEILIPINDKYLVSVDKSQKEILITTPTGFYDLFV